MAVKYKKTIPTARGLLTKLANVTTVFLFIARRETFVNFLSLSLTLVVHKKTLGGQKYCLFIN